jgi:hypothetical protein
MPPVAAPAFLADNGAASNAEKMSSYTPTGPTIAGVTGDLPPSPDLDFLLAEPMKPDRKAGALLAVMVLGALAAAVGLVFLFSGPSTAPAAPTQRAPAAQTEADVQPPRTDLGTTPTTDAAGDTDPVEPDDDTDDSQGTDDSTAGATDDDPGAGAGAPVDGSPEPSASAKSPTPIRRPPTGQGRPIRRPPKNKTPDPFGY